MQTIISDLLAIGALTKEVQWNARGQGLIAIHNYLCEVYDDVQHHVDQIAEHMAAWGTYGDPAFRVGEYETFPQLLVVPNPRDVRTGLSSLVYNLVLFTESLDEHLANQTDDPAGQDYVTQCLQDFSKHLWVLQSEVE